MRGNKQPRDGLGLTERQADCIGRRLVGMSQRQIAHDTGLAVGTVKLHLSAGYDVLGVHNQSDLVAYVARRSGVDLRVLFDRLRATPRKGE